LIKVTDYVMQQIPKFQDRTINVGYFGASTGVAASLYASGKLNEAFLNMDKGYCVTWR
jgi:hypothetical protein